MKKPDIQSHDDLVRLIVERPIWVYFHFNMGLGEDMKHNMNEIRGNASDALEGIKDFGIALIYLAGCVGLAIVQILLLLTYPFSKVARMLMVRKHVMKEYRQMKSRDQVKG